MSRVLAFVDQSPCALDVRATARWLGRLLDATVDVVHVVDPENHTLSNPDVSVRLVEGPTEDTLLRELRSSEVAAGVVGSRAIAAKVPALGHIAQSLLTATSTPLVVVPPESKQPTGDEVSVLVPLDGTTETAQALLPIANQLADGGAIVIICHVFDAGSIPPFISSPTDLEVLADEFAREHLPGLSPSCELRIGDPSCTVADLVGEVGAEAVLTAWHRDLAPGRANVMRRLLHETKVPLIVMPIEPA